MYNRLLSTTSPPDHLSLERIIHLHIAMMPYITRLDTATRYHEDP
jgi:hypothetical protein